MRHLLAVVTVLALALPFVTACSHTVSETDQTTHHLNGTETHDETTVKQNDLTGTVTKQHEENNSNP